jgi:hypothetical protein
MVNEGSGARVERELAPYSLDFKELSTMTRNDWWDACCVIGMLLIVVALTYLVVRVTL